MDKKTMYSHKQGRPSIEWGGLAVLGEQAVRTACWGNQKPFQEGGLSKERLRKVDMHDVGEKDLEKYDKRRRERKVGEECPAGLAGGQHN